MAAPVPPPTNKHWTVTPRPSLSSLQKYWLLRPGALTAGLRAHGTLRLRVLRETASGLTPQESWMLDQCAGSPIWVREIVMSINGTECVFARSFTPLADIHGLWQGMRRLRARPLADMLYHDPRIQRSPFCVARLEYSDPAWRALAHTLPSACVRPQDALARCSVFTRQQHPLLVMECFLPAFWTLARRV